MPFPPGAAHRRSSRTRGGAAIKGEPADTADNRYNEVKVMFLEEYASGPVRPCIRKRNSGEAARTA